jgi:TRAP-type C4-dicarboxylate transport system permease small subunit
MTTDRENSRMTAGEGLEALPDTVNDAGELTSRTWIPERALERLAAFLLLILTLYVAGTVIMRETGNGVLGAVEVSALAMVFVTALVVPSSTAADENFKVEILDMLNRPRLVDYAQVLGCCVQFLVALFLAFSTFELVVNDLTTKTTMAGELALPRWWLSLVLFVSFAVLVHASTVRLFRSVRDLRRRPSPPEAPVETHSAAEGEE